MTPSNSGIMARAIGSNDAADAADGEPMRATRASGDVLSDLCDTRHGQRLKMMLYSGSS